MLYWIAERENVRFEKESGKPKPWSKDPIFQVTYFCNVHREDDRVTKFIRQMYSPYVGHDLFTHNIILSRFLNWPPTLTAIGYQDTWSSEYISQILNVIRGFGAKVWGNAYVVSTCGRQMDKIDYLTHIVMPSIKDKAPWLDFDTCESAAIGLQRIEGISTFMAGQVVADLKNTEGHPLKDTTDWWSFALPGPGSIRGMDWLMGEKVPSSAWKGYLLVLQEIVYNELGIKLCAQDMQNCLCEFDKYMRVKNGTGRSKRSYNGV